ncbi:MAG: hypothetical protein E7644_02735 [Ruminococcaceae bacterium]|nr:hypothetical protein [Oscillospiraceae bacterium]
MKSKNTMIRLLSLLLVTLTVMSMLVACKPDTPDTPDTPGSTDGFNPVVRFAVASDLHLRDDNKGAYDFETRDRLAALYNTAYGYSEKQSYAKLDGVFLVGDFTQNGYDDEEMKDFFNYVKENTKDGTVSKSILGNHEFYETASDKNSQEYKDKYPNGFYDHRYTPESIAGTYANFLKYSGNKSVDEHIVINGYHFIFMAMDLYKKSSYEYYSDDQLDWLREQLQAAAADDATGKKPIFVFQHIGAKGTALGTGGGDKNLGAILSEYPQVVDFCGHSHSPLTDPRSIWQGDYTVLNTGSLAYLGIPIAGHPTYNASGVAATDQFGGWATGDIENSLRTGGMYYIIELDANNVMRVVIYDLVNNQVYGEPIIIDSVGQPDKFTFTDDRKRAAEKPAFAEDAKMEVLTVGETYATIKIPQATAGATTQNYRCDVYIGNSKKDSIYRLSGSYLGAGMPDFVTLPLTGLRRGTTYTVKVSPVSDWAKVGGLLEISFTTKTAADDPSPDYFSIRFNEDGTAINANTTMALDAIGKGAPKVEFDDDLKQYVGVFDGKSGFRFPMYHNYASLEDGFTMECYVNLEYTTTTPCLMSNQHSAGFGFELVDGNIVYYHHNGSSWIKPSAPMSFNRWVHLVSVFDGSTVKLYVDGELKSTKTCNKLSIPSAAAQYLVIGGDANQYEGQFFMSGKIAVANIYSDVLTVTQVNALYNALLD